MNGLHALTKVSMDIIQFLESAVQVCSVQICQSGIYNKEKWKMEMENGNGKWKRVYYLS